MIRTTSGVIASILFSAGVWGQSAPFAPSFEVASIRVHPDPAHVIGITTSGVRLQAQAEMVRGLIMWAYGLKNYQVDSPPAVYSPVGDTMYDIAAKVEGDTPPAKSAFRQMLQALLADRFKLRVHWENRESPVYELVVGKNGPKLKESSPDAAPTGHLQVHGRNYEVTLTKATMDDVVDAVANSFLDRPVVDKTGLTGIYDLKLVYTPSTRPNLQGEPSLDDISIFTAVQQLGLKLEARMGKVKTLVIDHVEKPSGN
ncbi:MAG TPA: TIGR03435 family protein [Bryobacteraceae bacterium]|nr:TIGR03435 family protein [Bryobacteraceae bacterium]